MTPHQAAQILGRRGGKASAAKEPTEAQRVARRGNVAKARSYLYALRAERDREAQRLAALVPPTKEP